MDRTIECPNCQAKVGWGEARCPSCGTITPTRPPTPILLADLGAAALSPDRPRAWLRAVGSSAAVEIDRPLVVGRATSCDVRLGLPMISRRHAQFLCKNGGYRVLDLGSRGGVFVNDTLITDEPLEEGDVVRIGPFEFVFTHEEPMHTPLPG